MSNADPVVVRVRPVHPSSWTSTALRPRRAATAATCRVARSTEVDVLSGGIVRGARRAGVPVPLNQPATA
jgi:ketopantoate reductase